jgi:hypothetical protein
MINKLVFKAFDRILRDLRDAPDLLFRGIPMIFDGDFTQILPIIKDANRDATVNVSLRRSFLWPFF